MTELLQRGFDPNTHNANGQRGLMLAMLEPSPNVAKVLIAWPKTDLEARNNSDETVLMLAALQGHEELVSILIKRGAHVNKPGWAPLHYAATNGHLAVMQQLLDAYAFIDAESPNGTTPLMMAAKYGSFESMKLLIDAGADLNIKNALGFTAIDFAQQAGRESFAKTLAESKVRTERAKMKRGSW